MMVETKACGAVVYRKKKGILYFLLIKHQNGGHWGFPKGHVEEGETEVQTALREIEEETGQSVRLRTGFRSQISYTPSSNVHKTVVFFLGKSHKKKIKIQENEIRHALWVETEDARRLITHPDVILVLNQALSFLES